MYPLFSSSRNEFFYSIYMIIKHLYSDFNSIQWAFESLEKDKMELTALEKYDGDTNENKLKWQDLEDREER